MPFFKEKAQELFNQRSEPVIQTEELRKQYEAQQNAQPVQKTAYQQNVAQPVQQNNNWYKGEIPTTGEIYGRIQTISKSDPALAQEIYTGFRQSQQDRTSPWYNPFTAPTNQAVNVLNSYGIDTRMLTDDWFNNNTEWQGSLIYNGTTNTPSKPGKKATDDQIVAYNIYQYKKSEEQTRKAESEWQALQQELAYKAWRPDRNYSDDAIIDSIDWNKYPTLANMKKSKYEGAPMELNRAIDFSDDSMRGVLWAARNNGGTGDMFANIANSATGQGNQWTENPELSAKLNWNDKKTYSPYSAGMTLDEEVGMYYGRCGFDQKAIDDIRATTDSNDETAMRMYKKVSKAWDDTQEAEKETLDIYNYAEKYIGKRSDDWIIDHVEKELAKGSYSMLRAIEDSIVNGSELLQFTRAINYRKQDLLQYIRDRNAEEAKKKNTGNIVNDTEGMLPGIAQTAEEIDQEAEDIIRRMHIEGNTPDITPNVQNLETEEPAPATSGTTYFKRPGTGGVTQGLAGSLDARDTSTHVANAGSMSDITLGSKKEESESGYTVDEKRAAYDSVYGQGAYDAALARANEISSGAQAQRDADQMVSDTVGYFEDELTPGESARFNGYSGASDQAQAVIKGKKDSYVRGDESLNDLISKNTAGVTKDYIEGTMALYGRASTYEQYQSDITLLEQKEKAYRDKLGGKVDRNIQPKTEFEVNLNGSRYRVEMDEDGQTINDIVLINNPDDPVSAAEFGTDYLLSLSNEIQGTPEMADFEKQYTEAKAKYDLANKIPISQEVEEELRRLRQIEIELEDARKYVEDNKEQYQKDLAEFNRLSQRREAHIQSLINMGASTTEIETSNIVMDYLMSFMDYEATRWATYNPTYKYSIMQDDGDSKEDIMAVMDQEHTEISEQIKDIEWLKKYIERHKIQIPGDMMNNIDRRLAKLKRDEKDQSFFSVRYNDDFAEVAKKGFELETEEALDYRSSRRLNNDFLVPGTLYFYTNGHDEYMTDDEKNTYYYLKAKDKENGTSKAEEYANFLNDRVYGVLNARAREYNEQFAKDVVDSGVGGFIAGNAYAILLSPYTAISSLAYNVERWINGNEFSPDDPLLTTMHIRSATREQSAQEILETFGKPIIDKATGKVSGYEETTASKIAQGGYEILTNRADSAINAAAFGWMFGGVGNEMLKEFLSASPMGISAATESAAKAKERGASDAQAMAIAAFTFAAETATEAISLENMSEAFKAGSGEGFRSFVKDWLTKAGVNEMFGESVNNIVENLSDEFIMGALSEHKSLVYEYRMAGKKKKEAEALARQDEIKGILRTALISYLSPGLDVFQTARGRYSYYGEITSRMNERSEQPVTLRQVRKYTRAVERGGDISPDISGPINADLYNQVVGEIRGTAPVQTAESTETTQAPEATQAPINPEVNGNQFRQEALDEKNRRARDKSAEYTINFEILESAKTYDQAGQNSAVAAVLDEGTGEAESENASAAAANLGDAFGEGADVIGETQDLMTGAMTNDIDIQTIQRGIKFAALGGPESACRQVVQSDAYKNATPDVKASMLAEAVEKDAANPEIGKAFMKSVHEDRVAKKMGGLIANGAAKVVDAAEARAIEKEGITLEAQNELNRQQAVTDAAMKAAQDAAAHADAATHERKLNEYMKEAQASRGYERNLEAAQREEKAAKEEAEKVKKETLTDIRQQAESMVAEEDQARAEQAEQERIAEENAAAEKAETERALNEQENAEEQQEQTSLEQNVRKRLQEIGYSGTDLENQVRRVMNRADQNSRKKENMDTRLSEKDGDKFLRKISRRTGITYEMQDLGDPLKTRGKIIDRSHMILNSNLTKGQALVEAALHEVTHGLEETNAYKNYASFVLNAMYHGENTKEYNDALKRKLNEYANDFKNLTPEEARERARQELVAEYARLNLGKKEFVRGIASNGLAGKFREILSNAVAMLKGYTLDAEGKAKYQEMRTAMKLLNEAVNERAQQTKKSNNGHTGLVQMSINGWTDATGLTLEVTGDDSHMYRLKYNGEEIKPGEYKAEMVKDTPVGNLIDMAGKARTEILTKKLERGKLTQDEYIKQIGKISKTSEQQREYVAQIINMIGQYQDAAMVWELSGSLAFSSLKTNGDPQYSDSYDFGTICTKTQAILNAISQTQVDLGRALTKAEIDGIVYEEVGKGVMKDGKWVHGATPCPPCYVYATWVNKPARLEKVRVYQQECANWTNEQINEFMNRPAPEGKTQTETKELKTEQNTQKLWISLCLADEVTNPETGEKTWVRKENPDICPNEILLDLRRSGDMAVQHPGTWTFMQKGGNAQGKAIAPYSDARLGESIVAKAIGAGEANARLLEDERNAENSEYIPQFLNPFLSTDPNDQKKAEEYFKKSIEKIKAQNLKGGQRWQSWSDFRAEWGSDYLMEMITMEALGSQVQTYTKVSEAIDLLASAGFEVNMSLMPHGDGFWHNEDGSIKIDEDGNMMLRFSNVTGINPEAAEAFAKKYGEKGNVQPMVVGISDEHIKAALAGDYITFVIPFHGSGGSVQRLQHLMSLLHEQMDSGNDYTKAQSDDFENFITVGEGKTKKKINTNPNWEIREKILTGEYDTATDEEIDALDNLPFLKKLYEDRYLNEDSDAFGVYFSKSEAQQIYPYEYWDTNTTLATADKNSQRFIEYCQMLGVKPRFSGLTKIEGKGKNAHEVEYANFSGRSVDENGNVTYNPVKGYWKLLIDRSMYNRVYDENGKIIPEKCTYHKPQAVSTADINIGAMPQAANNTVGHSDDDTRAITERIIQRIEMTSGQNEAAGSAVDLQQNAEAINNAVNEGVEQKSSRGDVSGAEADQILSSIGVETVVDRIARQNKQAEDAINALSAWTDGNPKTISDVDSILGTNKYSSLHQWLHNTYEKNIPQSQKGTAIISKSSIEQFISDDKKRIAEGIDSIAKGWGNLVIKHKTLDAKSTSLNPVTQGNTSAKVQSVISSLFNGGTGKYYRNKDTGASILLDKKSIKETLANTRKNSLDATERILHSADVLLENSIYIGDHINYAHPNTKVHYFVSVVNDNTENKTVLFAVHDPVSKDQANKFDAHVYVAEIKIIDNKKGAVSSLPAGINQTTQALRHAAPIKVSISDVLNSVNNDRIRSFDKHALAGKTLQSSTLGDLSDTEIDQILIDAGIMTSEELKRLNRSDRGEGVRQFNTVTGPKSDVFDERAMQYLQAHNHYIQDTNSAELARAINWISNNSSEEDPDGYHRSLEKVTNSSFNYRTKDGQARMIAMMGMAAARNDSHAQVELLRDYGKQGTDIAQALQARKLFSLMTPEGRMLAMERMLNNAQDEINKKGTSIKLVFSDWVYQAAAKAENAEDFEKVRKAAINELAEQIPANWKDRIRSLRMLSMLANPRTHIRNLVGNALFVPAVSLKNKLGAIAELGVKKGNKTKSLAIVSSSEIRNFARQDAENIKGLLTGEAKYSEATQIRKAQSKIGRAADAISDFNSRLLEGEDWLFLKGHYRRALGGWMTANGYTVEQVQNDAELLERGREYAINEAQKATYRDFNKTAQSLNQISQKGGVTGFLVDAALPFKKTPANILRRGLEYSPIGILKSLTSDLYHLKQYQDYQNGKLNAMPEKAMSPTQVIDHFCSGLSGTAILALGYMLAGCGAVSCGLDDDEDKFEKAQGAQEYAINPGKIANDALGLIGVPKLFGEDVTYTLDWAAPMSMPFFVGAAIRNMQQADGEAEIEDVLNAFGAISEPVFNLSMLDGINTLFNTSSYDNTNPITQILAKVGTNYVSSYVPSVLGAIARTIDDKQRKSFVEQGKGTGVMGTVRYSLEQMQNKIPFYNQQNIAVRNIWGEEKTSSFAERLIENFISPGYINQYENDPIINEMGRLFDVTGDTAMIPQEDPEKSITYTRDKVTHKVVLTDKEWDQFKAVRGQTAHSELTELLNSKAYQEATDTVKADMIKKIWSHATQVGKNAVVPEYTINEKSDSVAEIAQTSKIAGYKNEMLKALKVEDFDAYETMVQALIDEDVPESEIKQKISDTYRDEYKRVYWNGDSVRMAEIEDLLDSTGFDFDFEKWQEQEDKKHGIN